MITVATPEEIRAVNHAALQVEADFCRIRRTWPSGLVCSLCGATNPLPFGRRGGAPLCWRCKTGRGIEHHSILGDHQPPRLPTDPNDHKVLDEVQRIMALVIIPGVGTAVASNLSAWIGLQLAGLGTLRAAA